MNENEMIRTRRKRGRTPTHTGMAKSIAARVEEWPPGDIIDRDLENLDGALDELKGNVMWLMGCKEIHPVITVNRTLVEVCGTVHNLIANINEGNDVFAAVKEAAEEEGGCDERQPNDY